MRCRRQVNGLNKVTRLFQCDNDGNWLEVTIKLSFFFFFSFSSFAIRFNFPHLKDKLNESDRENTPEIFRVETEDRSARDLKGRDRKKIQRASNIWRLGNRDCCSRKTSNRNNCNLRTSRTDAESNGKLKKVCFYEPEKGRKRYTQAAETTNKRRTGVKLDDRLPSILATLLPHLAGPSDHL